MGVASHTTTPNKALRESLLPAPATANLVILVLMRTLPPEDTVAWKMNTALAHSATHPAGKRGPHPTGVTNSNYQGKISFPIQTESTEFPGSKGFSAGAS